MRALAVCSVECARVQAHCVAVKRTTPSLNREVIPRYYLSMREQNQRAVIGTVASNACFKGLCGRSQPANFEAADSGAISSKKAIVY